MKYKYKKGMKVRSLSDNMGCRTRGKIYTIFMDSNVEICYIGDKNNECFSRNIAEFEIIKELMSEIDYLDAFQNNFKEGV